MKIVKRQVLDGALNTFLNVPASVLATPRKINNVSFNASADIAIPPRLDYIPAVVQTLPRTLVKTDIAALTQGRVFLAYFIADQDVTINNLTTITGVTAAAATPTLCKMGIYSVDGSGNLTLLAATASDTTLWATASTAYTKALTAGAALTVGSRYAMGWICVTGVAMPSMMGSALPTGVSQIAPILAAVSTGQTDMPASITAASLTLGTANMFYVRGS